MRREDKTIVTKEWEEMPSGHQITTARILGIHTYGKKVTENQVARWLRVLHLAKPKCNITITAGKMTAVQIHEDSVEITKVMFQNYIPVPKPVRK